MYKLIPPCKKVLTPGFVLAFLLGLSAVCILPSKSVFADAELPRLGEDSGLNLQREKVLGQGLYDRLLEAGYIITDPILSGYLSDIGESLLSALDSRVRDYRFYLVNDNSINAFAAPGGYVAVNVGLIAATRTEDELAAVLAHEIAHVELMHSMQMIERAEEVNFAGMMAMLTAILVSTQNPEAAGAIMYSTAAGTTQSMINFTRTNEYEADRVGIEILRQSSYQPEGMVRFMSLLQKKEQSGVGLNIEYLRTHPMGVNRIAEIQARIRKIDKKRPKKTRYQQFKSYLNHLYPNKLLDGQSEDRFAQALSKIRNGDFHGAHRMMEKLRKEDPDSRWYATAMAGNLVNLKQNAKAEELYHSMLLLYPEDLSVALELVDLLIARDASKEALGVIQDLRTFHGKNAVFHRALVEVYSSTGQVIPRKLAEADYHWYSGHVRYATKLFKQLLNDAELTVAQRAGIQERLDSEKGKSRKGGKSQ